VLGVVHKAKHQKEREGGGRKKKGERSFPPFPKTLLHEAESLDPWSANEGGEREKGREKMSGHTYQTATKKSVKAGTWRSPQCSRGEKKEGRDLPMYRQPSEQTSTKQVIRRLLFEEGRKGRRKVLRRGTSNDVELPGTNYYFQ